jgi:hypothetical protein
VFISTYFEWSEKLSVIDFVIYLIDVWGFDEDAVKALRRMGSKPASAKKTDKPFEILLSSDAIPFKRVPKPVSTRHN